MLQSLQSATNKNIYSFAFKSQSVWNHRAATDSALNLAEFHIIYPAFLK